MMAVMAVIHDVGNGVGVPGRAANRFAG